jgi:hypothetical protein
VLAAITVLRDVPAVWAISGTVTLLALVAFLLSRTVGLPQIGDDIGNWTEPLSFPARAAEIITVVLAGRVLRRPGRGDSKGAPPSPGEHLVGCRPA